MHGVAVYLALIQVHGSDDVLAQAQQLTIASRHVILPCGTMLPLTASRRCTSGPRAGGGTPLSNRTTPRIQCAVLALQQMDWALPGKFPWSCRPHLPALQSPCREYTWADRRMGESGGYTASESSGPHGRGCTRRRITAPSAHQQTREDSSTGRLASTHLCMHRRQ